MLLDCTSGDPPSSRQIAQQLAEKDIAFADAPVSGGTNGAEAGTLTVMVGADASTFQRARPVLEAFGQHIQYMGPVGTGHAMKAVNGRAVEVLNASSGRSFVSESLVPERVLTGAWPRTFRLALLDKDVGIARDLLKDTGVAGAIIATSGLLLAEARAALGEEADYLGAIRWIEQQASVEIRD